MSVIFGTSAAELAEVQHPRYRRPASSLRAEILTLRENQRLAARLAG